MAAFFRTKERKFMITKIRDTITGTEFWDYENKKTLFVPAGEEPDFKVSVDESEDATDEAKQSTDDSNKNIKDLDSFGFDSMTLPQLKAYAEENGIVIPEGTTKRSDIIKLLS